MNDPQAQIAWLSAQQKTPALRPRHGSSSCLRAHLAAVGSNGWFGSARGVPSHTVRGGSFPLPARGDPSTRCPSGLNFTKIPCGSRRFRGTGYASSSRPLVASQRRTGVKLVPAYTRIRLPSGLIEQPPSTPSSRETSLPVVVSQTDGFPPYVPHKTRVPSRLNWMSPDEILKGISNRFAPVIPSRISKHLRSLFASVNNRPSSVKLKRGFRLPNASDQSSFPAFRSQHFNTPASPNAKSLARCGLSAAVVARSVCHDNRRWAPGLKYTRTARSTTNSSRRVSNSTTRMPVSVGSARYRPASSYATGKRVRLPKKLAGDG